MALDVRDFDVVLGMDCLSRHRATIDYYKKEVKLHRQGNWRLSSGEYVESYLLV